MKRSHTPLPCVGIQRSHADAVSFPSQLIRTETSGLAAPTPIPPGVPRPPLMDILFHALRSAGVAEEDLADVLSAALSMLVLGTLPPDVISRVDPSTAESVDMD